MLRLAMVLGVWFFGVCLLPPGTYAQRPELKIFILHSYHQEYPWTREVHRGFIDTLAQDLPDTPLTVATESLDTKRLPYTPEYAEGFFHYLQIRYANWRPDLIFLSDDDALSFLRDYGPRLFPGVPVHFCGVNRLELRSELQPPAYQGVFEVVPVAENLKLAQRFDPTLDKVTFVGDGSSTHAAMARRIASTMPQFSPLDYEILGERRLQQLLTMLRAKQQGTLVLTTVGALVDEEGETLPLAHSITKIAAAGDFRIYCMEENNLQPGVLGGELNSGWAHGAFVARQIINQRRYGAPVEVVSDHSPTLAMFDYRQLERFHIAPRQLPAGAIMTHEPQGFYYRYRHLVWWTLGFIGLQGVIILGLTHTVRRRRLAELALCEQQERLRHLAHHDALTGLPNRVLFSDRLQHAMDLARRYRYQVALLFLDLDHFKNVNDTLGHDLGDRLLCQVARRLRESVRQSDTVARLGGDEFVVVMENVETEDAAVKMARKIGAALREPIPVGGNELSVTTSIGVSLFPQNGTALEGLMRCADIAMYRAKALGGNTFQIFRTEMGDSSNARLALESQLRRGIELGQLVLHYQPQVALATGRLRGVEVLVRWRHPERGLIPPGDFIPLAEEAGLMPSLGAWVLNKACLQLRDWQEMGLQPPPVSINLSPRQFDDEGQRLLMTVEESLRNSDLPHGMLRLEVSEHQLMANRSAMLPTLKTLAEQGVQVVIDNFGLGYAIVSDLEQMPVHTLIIDRSLIRDLQQDPQDEELVRAILALAEGLGVTVVAKGVDREGQRQWLLEHGCPHGQGFLFGKPLPSWEMEAFLQRLNAQGLQETWPLNPDLKNLRQA